MAARGAYRSFSSAARNAFHSARSSSYSARSTHNAQFPPPPRRSGCTNTMPTMTRRRMAETMVPLHNAVAQAKLISHLAVSSRSRTSLSLGVYSLYLPIPFQVIFLVGLQGFYSTQWSSLMNTEVIC